MIGLLGNVLYAQFIISIVYWHQIIHIKDADIEWIKIENKEMLVLVTY